MTEMPLKVVVVGGVAGGMSAAARLRRLDERAEIVVLERDHYVSFANCGLPYYVGGEITDRSALLLQTPRALAANLALDVRVASEVVSIDRANRTVLVRELDSGREYEEAYDRLVLATGALPIRPPIPGIDHPRIRTLRTVPDADAMTELLGPTGHVDRAVVVGGGYIGVEVAEALRHRDREVVLVEQADQVMGPLDHELAYAVERELRRNGVEVRTGSGVTGFAERPDGGLRVTLADGAELDAELVVLAIGVRPDTRLHRDAGLQLHPDGSVVVDEHQRTSDPLIYAVGDSVGVTHLVSGEHVVIPLAGPANRQGRIAADHIAGRTGTSARYTTTQGTSVVKVFEVTAGATGLNERALQRLGMPYHAVHLHPNGHAGYYPGSRAMHLKVMFAADDGRVLGAEAAGYDGVDKRLDVLATAIRSGLTAYDLEELELAYAPPYGSAKDPVNMAGFMGANILRGDLRLWYPADWSDFDESVQIVDVRSKRENEACALPGSILIPLPQLRRRFAELDRDRPVRLYCASGFRSYLAYRVLVQEGFSDVATLSGGVRTMRAAVPGLTDALAAAEIPGPVVLHAEEEQALSCNLDLLAAQR